jgi:hypothetical protein
LFGIGESLVGQVEVVSEGVDFVMGLGQFTQQVVEAGFGGV